MQERSPISHGTRVRGALAERLLVEQLGHCSFPLVLVIVVGVILGIQGGFGAPGTLVLLIGAFVSGVAMFLYALPTVLLSSGGKKRPWMVFATLGGIAPFAFGLYLILVVGLWSPVRAPSLGNAGLGALFLATGFWYLRGLGRLAQLVRRIDQVMRLEGDSADEGVPQDVEDVEGLVE